MHNNNQNNAKTIPIEAKFRHYRRVLCTVLLYKMKVGNEEYIKHCELPYYTVSSKTNIIKLAFSKFSKWLHPEIISRLYLWYIANDFSFLHVARHYLAFQLMING